ncbi:MAG: SusD/RagB family nutrient-binding outer membrane lipoprotein [Bacteroidota bacterium]
MKKYFVHILFGAFALILSGCQDAFDNALDINDDPLAATSVDPNLLFPEILVNFSNNRTIEISGRTSAIVQYTEPAFGVFGDMALGELGNTFLVGNIWANNYTDCLKNLVLAETTAAQAEPANNNVIMQSKILQAMVYYQLTGLWEEVPFSEAVNFDIPEPVFDRQEDILRGVVSMIDEAIALKDDTDGSFRVTTGDLIFNGDLDKWERFGNSIKLKALFLLANQDQSVAGEIAAVLNAPLITTLADEAEFQYFDNPGDFNPIWNTLNRFSGGSNPEWWIGSTTFQAVMEDLNDPRLATYYDESDEADVIGTGDFRPGAQPGSFGGSCEDCSIVSANILRPDFPDRYMTAAEIVLLQAEAIASGYASGDLAAANEKYKEGISLSMQFFDGKPGAVSAEDQQAYLDALPNLETLSQEEALEAIHIQLYINNFFRMPEGWIQWKRTKVPDLVTPIGSQLSDIIRRLFYPPDEKGANPNIPDEKSMDTPMWFEK